ncbi:MAG TPA: NAD(P)/FAD-dependent oxidoreductase [Vicinamibacterales bacterium]|nr:NAD(P)/FAD-dependent oxidoreductase [Vicinamibacterales bacterium]
MRIGIVGAGPAGLVAAIAARQRGFAPTVFEQAPAFARVGGAVGIQCNGLQALESIGVLDRFHPFIELTEAVGLEAPPGRRISYVNFAEVDLPIRGFGVALRSDLQSVLLDAARRLGVDVCFGHRCTNVRAGAGVALTFENGRTETVDLVLACDGIHSVVRGSMRFHARKHPVNEAYLRVVADRAHPDRDRIGEVWAADGRRAGAFPLPGERTYMFCSVPIGRWDDILRDRLGAWVESWNDLGPVIAAAAQGVRDWSTAVYDELYDLRVDRWYEDSVVLVGDAAHAMTPNLGQGANCAMTDAVVFVNLLAECRSDWRRAAERYEAIRKPFVTRIQNAALFGGRLAAFTSTPARALRDLFFLAGSRITPLRRASMRLTAGYNPAEQPYLTAGTLRAPESGCYRDSL